MPYPSWSWEARGCQKAVTDTRTAEYRPFWNWTLPWLLREQRQLRGHHAGKSLVSSQSRSSDAVVQFGEKSQQAPSILQSRGPNPTSFPPPSECPFLPENVPFSCLLFPIVPPDWLGHSVKVQKLGTRSPLLATYLCSMQGGRKLLWALVRTLARKAGMGFTRYAATYTCPALKSRHSLCK